MFEILIISGLTCKLKSTWLNWMVISITPDLTPYRINRMTIIEYSYIAIMLHFCFILTELFCEAELDVHFLWKWYFIHFCASVMCLPRDMSASGIGKWWLCSQAYTVPVYGVQHHAPHGDTVSVLLLLVILLYDLATLIWFAMCVPVTFHSFEFNLYFYYFCSLVSYMLVYCLG